MIEPYLQWLDINVIFIVHFNYFWFPLLASIFLVFFWKISIFPKLLQSLEFTPYTIQTSLHDYWNT